MGTPTDAILAYGYDLGGPDTWLVHGTGEYGELPALDWYDEEADGADFVGAVEQRLLVAVAQFTEEWTPDARANGYYERLEAAKARIGVTVATYCSDSAPQYLLAAHVTTVHRGHVETVDPADLAERPRAHGWDDRLAGAVDALGLTPIHPAPRWLIASYWGQ